MRRKLVETLYTQPTSLAAGAVAGIACTATAMVMGGSPAILFVGSLLIAAAIARMALAAWMARDTGNRDARTLEIVYEIGAFSYAFLAGLVAATAIYERSGGSVETLTVTYALVYGVGISARNAGRPMIAIGQLIRSATRCSPKSATGCARPRPKARSSRGSAATSSSSSPK